MIFPKPEWWDEWTYFDELRMSVQLRKGAPESVKEEWDDLTTTSL